MSARRAFARDVARGMAYAFGTAAAVLATLYAGGVDPAALMAPDDAPRVSSVVGARMDNFNPGAALDTSQVVAGDGMGGAR